MTNNIEFVSSELLRISSYAGVMSKLAQSGESKTIEFAQLQTIFDDVSKVTGWAYTHLENAKLGDSRFDNPFDKPYR